MVVPQRPDGNFFLAFLRVTESLAGRFADGTGAMDADRYAIEPARVQRPMNRVIHRASETRGFEPTRAVLERGRAICRFGVNLSIPAFFDFGCTA
jgi:hypothetical protein